MLAVPTYTEAHGRHDGLQSFSRSVVQPFSRSEMMESTIAAADIEKAHHESRVISHYISHYVLPQVVRQPAAQSVRHKKDIV